MNQDSPFETISTERKTLGRFTVVSDQVKVNGKVCPYDYLEIKEGVCILPILISSGEFMHGAGLAAWARHRGVK